MVVRAICISESAPSCIRAPPEAVKTTKAPRAATASRAAATKASPRPAPIEPPMKAKFMTATTAGRPSIGAAGGLERVDGLWSAPCASFRRSV